MPTLSRPWVLFLLYTLFIGTASADTDFLLDDEGNIIDDPSAQDTSAGATPEDHTGEDASPTSHTVEAQEAAGADQTTLIADAEATAESAATEEGWIGQGQDYAQLKANELTRWLDDFFGDQERDIEGAESRLRLRTIFIDDERLGGDAKIRIGGKVNLPSISERLDLVFEGEDRDNMADSAATDPDEARIGLQYSILDWLDVDESRHRFHLTVGFGSSGPKPGVKYVYRNNLSDETSFRFTQRFVYDLGDGAYGTSRFVLDRSLGEKKVLRAYSKLLYGEETFGTEWNTSLTYATGRVLEDGNWGAVSTYVAAEGRTEPYSYVKNYRVGARLRRQAFYDFLFIELEPSYNWRIDEPYFDREGAWRVELRFEFLLFDNPTEDETNRLF